MRKKIGNTDYIMLLSMFLIISVIINVYALFKLNNYKYKSEQQSYSKIEDFRQRNESNMDILFKGIEEGSIRNEELFKLYKNYDVMSSDIIELWQQYRSYSQNALPLISKSIKTNKVVENDIHEKIKEYMLSTLNKEMKNENSKLQLKDEDLKSFNYMYEISKKMHDYLNEFNEETLKGVTGKEKEKIVVKQNYWIDMLQGIYNISSEYVDVQWKIEQANANSLE